jgi:hypothetical protein
MKQFMQGKTRLRVVLTSAIVMVAMAVPLLSTQVTGGTAFAATSTFKSDACAGLGSVDASQGCGTGNAGVNSIISDVVNVISMIAGALAVIFIIISGIRYMTSGGDSGKVAGAKSALIYAIIGLAVAGLAQVIVHDVITTGSNALTPVPKKK